MSKLIDFFLLNEFSIAHVEDFQEGLSFHIKVLANPGAKKEGLTKGIEGCLKVSIKERPIDGKANEGLVKFLSKKLGPSKSNITLEKGSKSKFKTFMIRYQFTKQKDAEYYLEMLKRGIDV